MLRVEAKHTSRSGPQIIEARALVNTPVSGKPRLSSKHQYIKILVGSVLCMHTRSSVWTRALLPKLTVLVQLNSQELYKRFVSCFLKECNGAWAFTRYRRFYLFDNLNI